MKLFAGDTPEVRAADAQPWDAPFAGTMRAFTVRGLQELAYGAGVLYLLVPFSFGALRIDGAKADHPLLLWVVAVYGTVISVAMFVLPVTVPVRWLRRIAPPFNLFNTLMATCLISCMLVAIGPTGTGVIGTYANVAMYACYTMPKRWAAAVVVLVLGAFTAVELFGPALRLPALNWLWVFAAAVAGAGFIGVVGARADRLAASEGEARRLLAAANEQLESRVETQSGEIDRLGELRRFLSPQIADAVLSNGTSALAKPHRQRIAVFFCDLRGFTAFTNQAEPEEVVAVLDEYYATVGSLLHQYDATIGDYAGDGIMAYFGDPVPRPEPALDAVAMVNDLRPQLDALVARWDRAGYDLGYGMGIAFGYATLGVVGFEGRYEYTPLGAVVNLGARLCSHAARGQVLLDHATHAATTDHIPSERIEDLDLKGYGTPARAYALGPTTATLRR